MAPTNPGRRAIALVRAVRAFSMSSDGKMHRADLGKGVCRCRTVLRDGFHQLNGTDRPHPDANSRSPYL